MSYKKNQTPYFDLGRDKFGNYTNRLNDNLDESLYTKTTDMWYGICLSGFSQESITSGQYELSTNPVELVDLGDKIKRYKVRVKIFSRSFDSVYSSPTSFFPELISGLEEEELAYRVSKYPHAYTENISQKPIIGSRILLEDLGGTFFIKKIVAPTEDIFKSITSADTTLGQFNGGIEYSRTVLGKGWLPGTTLIPSFGGFKIPCSALVSFGRDKPADFFVYGKNPAPSPATDDKYWALVLKHLGTNSTPNKIRLFHAWSAKESTPSTNNPFATSHPGGGRPWSKDPNMTAHNWSKDGKRAWVRNYSTMDIGALATAITIRSKNSKNQLRYGSILAKLKEKDPEFPDSWFKSSKIKKEFETWGGRKGDGVGYWKGVMLAYKNKKRRRKPINTNTPGGRTSYCVDKT